MQLSFGGIENHTYKTGQWMTDPKLARRVAQWAGVGPGMRVLEPSAGHGALVEPCLEAGAHVTAFELDPVLYRGLWGRFITRDYGCNFVGFCEDYLASVHKGPRHDLTLGNPPYEDDRDMEFVLKALSESDRVVAILRLAFLAGVERHKRIWSQFNLTRQVLFPRRPKFEGEGDGTAKSDFTVVEIMQGPPQEKHLVELEWW